MLAEMQRYSCQKEVITFNPIISAAQKGRQWELALATLTDMYISLVEADEISYSAAIAACHHCARWEQALDLFRGLHAAGLTQGPASCNATVIACMASNQWQAAARCLREAPVADLTICRPSLDASGRAGLPALLRYGAERFTKQLAFEVKLRPIGVQRSVMRPPLLQEGRLHGGLPPGSDMYVAGASLELVAAAAEALSSHILLSEGIGRAFWRGVLADVTPACMTLQSVDPREKTGLARADRQLRIDALRNRAFVGASFLKVLLSATLKNPPDVGETLRDKFLSHMCEEACQAVVNRSLEKGTNHLTKSDQAWFAPLKPVPAAAHLLTTTLIELRLSYRSQVSGIFDLFVCSGVSRRAVSFAASKQNMRNCRCEALEESLGESLAHAFPRCSTAAMALHADSRHNDELSVDFKSIKRAK